MNRITRAVPIGIVGWLCGMSINTASLAQLADDELINPADVIARVEGQFTDFAHGALECDNRPWPMQNVEVIGIYQTDKEAAVFIRRDVLTSGGDPYCDEIKEPDTLEMVKLNDGGWFFPEYFARLHE